MAKRMNYNFHSFRQQLFWIGFITFTSSWFYMVLQRNVYCLQIFIIIYNKGYQIITLILI